MATIAQIKADMARKVGVAMENVKRDVRRIFIEVVQEYYASYTPVMYERTKQIEMLAEDIANAAVKVRMVGASFEVYFDSSALTYENGKWSEDMVLSNVMSVGNHGNTTRPHGTVPVWNVGLGRLNAELKGLIRTALIRAGIPIH